MAQVRGLHCRQNAFSSRKPPELLAKCWRASTVPLPLITTTALKPLLRVDADHHLGRHASLCGLDANGEEGSATSSVDSPLSSHSPQSGARRELSISEPHRERGQPDTEPPAEHRDPGWRAEGLKWWF